MQTENPNSDRVLLGRSQSSSLLNMHFFETPGGQPGGPELWTYTDSLSYAPGETVTFFTHATMSHYEISVDREGCTPTNVHQSGQRPGHKQITKSDASVEGCKWKATHEWVVPDHTPSGGYVITTRAQNGEQDALEQHHIIFIRPTMDANARSQRLLLIACTATWNAYNPWGGSNHYAGVSGSDRGGMSPELSQKRPFERGFVRLPKGAPRSTTWRSDEPFSMPIYGPPTWALANGYSRYYAAAGWASFEHPFLMWAEQAGFAIDCISQTDLHYRPELLDGYGAIVTVGHDEYWSWEMRDAIDNYVENGGNVARFAGNFLWQIRLEQEGARQICHKYWAHEDDPEIHGPSPERMTGAWEHPMVGRPGAKTLGLNGLWGMYAGFGKCVPRSGGFFVYRAGHWALKGSGLSYGDQFGEKAGIFGWEVDGVDYTFRHGLPFATGDDGASDGLQILAMAPATMVEDDQVPVGTTLYIGQDDAIFKTLCYPGPPYNGDIERLKYGAGMIAVCQIGKGTVFNAGTCEWVAGLGQGDFATQKITANVLNHFLQTG